LLEDGFTVRELIVIGGIDYDVFDGKRKENREENRKYIVRE